MNKKKAGKRLAQIEETEKAIGNVQKAVRGACVPLAKAINNVASSFVEVFRKPSESAVDLFREFMAKEEAKKNKNPFEDERDI